MRHILACLLAAAFLVITAKAGSQTLEAELPVLAAKLSKSLAGQGFKNVASVDFTDLQGRQTELGRYLAERLSVEMVSTGGPAMLDRGNIRRILAEHKLTEDGLVNPANAKKLGEFAGADAILIGTVTTRQSEIELMVKAVSTEGARIVAAGRITFPSTNDYTQPSTTIVDAAPSPDSEDNPSYHPAPVIAFKDLGALRVGLKAVRSMRLPGRYGRDSLGIRCSFEFTNRDTRSPVRVAANAESRYADSRYGEVLRWNLVDDRGERWTITSRTMSGLGYVRAGVHGKWSEPYDPSEIARLLRLREELGRDQDDPSDGTTDGSGFVTGYNTSNEPPRTFFQFKGNRFISGATTEIKPAGTMVVTMDFESESGRDLVPRFIQLTGELVSGRVTASDKASYSLESVVFDRVELRAR